MADTNKLELGITSGSDLAVIYHNLCTRVIHSIKVAKEEVARNTKKEAPPPIHKTELIVSAIKYTIKEEDRVCKNLQQDYPKYEIGTITVEYFNSCKKETSGTSKPASNSTPTSTNSYT